jgi:integrase
LEKNPIKGVKLPRTCGGKLRAGGVLSPTQVRDLALALPEPFATLFLFLYATGLRIGECAGLRWSDLLAGALHVRRRDYGAKLDSVKTRGSSRVLPIPFELELRLLTLRETDADGYIFQARNGSPLNPGNWLQREIRPVATKLGIKLSGWHDFRRSLATNLRRGHAFEDRQRDPRATAECSSHRTLTT